MCICAKKIINSSLLVFWVEFDLSEVTDVHTYSVQESFNDCLNHHSQSQGKRTCILLLTLVLIRCLWPVDPDCSRSVSAPTANI